MTKTEMIMNLGNNRYLVKTDAKLTPYVICKNYNPSMPVGSQWDLGHYYRTEDEALEDISLAEVYHALQVAIERL